MAGENEEVRAIYPCNINLCNFASRHLKKLIKHFIRVHPLSRNLTCNINGCKSQPSNPFAFRTHVYQYHQEHYHDVCNHERAANSQPAAAALDWELIEQFDHPHNEFPRRSRTNLASARELFDVAMKELKKKSIRLRLFLEHEYEVPACNMVRMHSTMVNFFSEIHESISASVLRRLREIGVKDDLLELLVRAGGNLHDHIYVTEYASLKAFKKLQFVEPQKIPFLSGGVMHYVPILETLKLYLSNNEVLDSISTTPEPAPHVKGFTTGTFFQRHPVFSQDRSALRINLYIDEFEVCNPIGSKRGDHKLTGVYFSVGNIEQHHLSSLKSIHLAILCRYVYVQKVGYNQVLKPLIDDLRKLQTEGIYLVSENGAGRFWKGSLAFVCGDNLTLNALGGFRKSFSSGRLCRFCMSDFSNLKSVMCEADCVLRSSSVHAMHVDSVKMYPELGNVYGVYGPSPFDDLNIGSPMELLVPDIMHDILEGLMSFHITNLIRSLQRTKVVQLKTTIRCIKKFSYGCNDKVSKPREISKFFMRKKYHLVGSASERWTLFRTLPLSLGHLVPEGNKHWQLYLLSARIFDILLAPILETEWVCALDDLVREHHELWVELYPSDCKYKWHVLVHYARIIASMGSLRHLWTMRFESFHQFFIRTAKKLKNYKTISHTLSWRFQRRRAVQNSEAVLPPKISIQGRQVSVKLREKGPLVANAISSNFGIGLDEEVCWVRRASYCGLKYKSGDLVVLDVAGDGVPIFLKITEIYIVDGNVALLGQLTYVKCWNEHVHAFEVHVSENRDDYVCVEAQDVISPQTLDSYELRGTVFVRLHFAAARKNIL